MLDSERELNNVALILSEQIDRSFQAIELVQRSIAEKIQSLGIASSEDYARQLSGQDVHVMLETSISGLAHIDAITLIDADGKLLNFSRAWPIIDLGHFQHLCLARLQIDRAMNIERLAAGCLLTAIAIPFGAQHPAACT